jgi:hypothetical protein
MRHVAEKVSSYCTFGEKLSPVKRDQRSQSATFFMTIAANISSGIDSQLTSCCSRRKELLDVMHLIHLLFLVFFFFCRNSVPQSPNFPVGNASAHEDVLQRVTEMFKLNFPYTTLYPALGNLDVLHPLEQEEDPHRVENHYPRSSKKQQRLRDDLRRGRRRGQGGRKCEYLRFFLKKNHHRPPESCRIFLNINSVGVANS